MLPQPNAVPYLYAYKYDPERLVGVRETAHTRHNAEHVVVDGVDADLRRVVRVDRVVGEREQQRRVINTREVAAAGRLVLLRLEGERVHVDAHGGDVRVVLVRLHQVEVATLALRETVVSVELDLRRDDRVVARHALHAGDGVARLQHRPIPPVGVVERLLTLPGVDDRRVAADEAVALDNPHQLLRGVVEVHLDLVGRRRHGLAARELQLLDQVLVRDLGEAAALIRVEVDVVNVQRRRHQASRRNALLDGVRRVLDRHAANRGGGVVPLEHVEGVELEPDLDLVVLERNERQRQTRVAVEPELEGDVQRVLRRAVAHLLRGVGLARAARVVAALTALDDQVRQGGHVAHHLGVARLETRLLRQLVPDLEPVTVVLVNLLTADLHVDVVDEVVANPVEPAELRTRAVRRLERDLGERALEVDAVDQIAVAADRALHLLAEVRRAVERLLNGLHGEVRVAAVDHLEEGNLRVAR